MIEVILYLILLGFGIPVGFFLAWLCSDEVKNWRRRFLLIALVSLILVAFVFFSDFIYKIPVIVSLLFIVVVNIAVVRKSK